MRKVRRRGAREWVYNSILCNPGSPLSPPPPPWMESNGCSHRTLLEKILGAPVGKRGGKEQ